VNVAPDSQLVKVLESYGWSNSSFQGDIDVLHLRQDVGNIYLSHPLLLNQPPDAVENLMTIFCPNLLLYALNEKPRVELQPFSKKFYGTCILADISGFTALASSLCRVNHLDSNTIRSSSDSTLNASFNKTIRDYLKHSTIINGSYGLDELRSATNIFLGNLVQVVYSFGGDVIEFAGDALICVFEDDTTKENLNDNCHSVRAYHCAQVSGCIMYDLSRVLLHST
jgi:hypothetical protein